MKGRRPISFRRNQQEGDYNWLIIMWFNSIKIFTRNLHIDSFAWGQGWSTLQCWLCCISAIVPVFPAFDRWVSSTPSWCSQLTSSGSNLIVPIPVLTIPKQHRIKMLLKCFLRCSAHSSWFWPVDVEVPFSASIMALLVHMWICPILRGYSLVPGVNTHPVTPELPSSPRASHFNLWDNTS